MGARFRSWWQKIKRPLSVIGVIAASVLVIALIVGIIGGYLFNWNWTGLSRKTLWDWLQLLIIPAVLAVGGSVINLTISRSEQEATKQRAQSEREAAEKRAETERKIALDNQCQAALQDYIDKMSELLLHEDLRGGSDPEKEVRKIARVRTLTVLLHLDSQRKRTVLNFLLESGLIGNYNAVVDISRADLSDTFIGLVNFAGANLRFVNFAGAVLDSTTLEGADLMGANLKGADLEGANLTGAKLHYVKLEGADLTEANLKGVTGINEDQLEKQAQSLQGATMPDGSIHP